MTCDVACAPWSASNRRFTGPERDHPPLMAKSVSGDSEGGGENIPHSTVTTIITCMGGRKNRLMGSVRQLVL